MGLRKILGYLPQEFEYTLICLQKTIGLFCSTKGIASKVERAAIVKQVLGKNLYEVRLKDVNGYSGG
jgi:ABC-type multidrug transport system ATPase subunit